MKKILLAIIGLLIIVGLGYGIKMLIERSTVQQPGKSDLPTIATATVLTPPKPIMPFSLSSTQGENFTQNSFTGQWTLVFFGYAHCKAICPQTLAIISNLYKSLLEQNLPRPQFVFISLDPTEDTVPHLQAFLSRFNPTFIGLTGDENTIATLSKACSIYSYLDAPDSNGQKVIDHSAALLLVNPTGRITALFSPPHEPNNILQDLKTLMKS